MSLPTESFLDGFAPDIRELALRTRELVRSVMPDAHEMLRPSYRTIAYGRGQKMADEICYISPLSSGVNLGFHFGTQLPDPSGLLKGTGKLMRHVRIQKKDDLDDPAVRALLEAANIHASF